MTILPQTLIENVLKDEIFIQNLVSPLSTSFSIDNYTELITSVSNHLYHQIRQTIIQLIEKMDQNFRQLPGRSQRYYVKDKRPRTLITPIGIITFNRTIYQSRIDGSTYAHVDERLGLPKYDRYDPCVKAMVVEAYSKLNSMIKVGELIGDRIYSPFCLKPDRENYRISRQTVFNIITKVGQLIFEPPPTTSQINSLFIMADEKYIPLQNSHKEKAMIKAITIYEGRKSIKKRVTLLNKTVFFTEEGAIWEDIHHFLDGRYDLEKIKAIHILGDGAKWIKSGLSELKSADTNTTFSLDEFHYRQAINRITSHPELRLILHNYIKNQDRKNFNKLTNRLLNDKDLHLKQADEQIKYLKGNWHAIQNTLNHLKIPCSMEAAISHNLASQFTSVPKAYSEKHLPIYLNHRMHYLNHYDIRKLYLEAIHIRPNHEGIKKLDPPLNLSIFDKRPRYDKSSTSNWIKGLIARN